MFDLTTILTLIAPAVIAPLGCLVFLRAIERAEAARRPGRAPAPPIQIGLEPPTEIGLEPALSVDHAQARNVA